MRNDSKHESPHPNLNIAECAPEQYYVAINDSPGAFMMSHS